MAIQNSSKKEMKSFLSDFFFIPMNQRDYSWGIEQIEDFWEDLQSVIKNPGRQHFYGQIVVYHDIEKSKKYLIDGQQRTVTAMIFLRALQFIGKELSKEANEDEQKNGLTELHSILQQILGLPPNKFNTETKFHLQFENEIEENDYYSKNILNDGPTNEKINMPACENMRAAYYYFYKKLTKELENRTLDDKIKTLYNYTNNFLEHFEVMYLETNDLGESYVIFETLNARGKALETADLLKNYVFSQAQENIKSIQERWKKVTDNLDGLDLTRYIRYYWNARYGLVREKDLYREISANIKTPRESLDLVSDLKNNSLYYHDACNPDSCEIYDDDDIIKRLRALQTLKATTYIPILLALEMRGDAFTTKDKANILRAIEVYVFRNATIAGKTANDTEKFFSLIAKKIYEQEYVHATDIISTIKSGMISDQDFFNSFCTFATKTQPYIRYILISIHEFLTDNLEINRNFRRVNIEHIMPKNASQWKEISEKDHEAYLWRLGNLALLDEKLNKSISNKPFSEKKNIYKRSLIQPNPELAKLSEWTTKEIENRQKILAEYALKIWK